MSNNNPSHEKLKRKRLYENISCITIDADSSEFNLKGLSYFDVPLENYKEGCLTGTRLAYEFLKEAAQNDSLDSLTRVLREASKELDKDNGGPDTVSKLGAAAGLADTVQEIFNFAASRLDFTEVFKRTFDFYEADLVNQLASIRKTNAEILTGLAIKGGAAPTAQLRNTIQPLGMSGVQ